MNKINDNKGESAVGAMVLLTMLLWMVASWLTHVIVCIRESEWLFLIAGAVFGPIGMIHGTGIWMGVW